MTKLSGLLRHCRPNMCGVVVTTLVNFLARARDPLWEESWDSGKKPKKCTKFTAFHYYQIQYTRQARNI